MSPFSDKDSLVSLGEIPHKFMPQPHHGGDELVTAQFCGWGLDQLSLESSTSLSFPEMFLFLD